MAKIASQERAIGSVKKGGGRFFMNVNSNLLLF